MAAQNQGRTRGHPPNDDLPWDLSRLPLPADQSAIDAAVDVLEDAQPETRATVRRVRDALVGAIPTDAPSPTDWIRAMQHTDGQLVAVTWSSAGFNEIGYDTDEERYVVAGYSALDRLQGKDPHFTETSTRSAAKDLLHGSPRAVTADEATLLDGGER